MAGSRIPGPLGSGGIHNSIDEGTLTRTHSPLPGSLGHNSPLRRITLARAGIGGASIYPVLRIGQRGPDVEQVQRLLNARLRLSPALPVNGDFDSAVQQHIRHLQQSHNLASSGEMDAATWFVLLKGDKSSIDHNVNTAVAEWTLQQKFTEVLWFTLRKLPMSMRQEFAMLISPASIGIMVGTLTVWAGSHAFGVGEIIDIALLLAGVMYLGFIVQDVAGHLSDFIKLTCAAKTQRELENAASHLAEVIAMLGVAVFAAILTKGARRFSSSSAPKRSSPVKEEGPKVIKRVEASTERPTPAKNQVPAKTSAEHSYYVKKIPNDLSPNSKGVYGYVPKEGTEFAPPKWPVDWTNQKQVAAARAVRLDYHAGLESEKRLIEGMRSSGHTDDEIARNIVDLRNKTRMSKYSEEQLPVLYERNINKYGNKYGPTYESLLEKYKSPQMIIEAGTRSNPSMDVLTGIGIIRP